MADQEIPLQQEKPITPFVLITPNNKGFELMWAFTTFSNKTDTGKLACHIPAFDLHFTASDDESMKKKAKAITKLFFDHYVLNSGKNGLKNIALQLHKLGFKAPNDTNTIHQLINNKVVKAKFKSLRNSPDAEFSNTRRSNQEVTMEVAG